MSKLNIDFHNTECSACHNKSVDVRTEVLIPTEKSKKEKRIRKIIIFRCAAHPNTDVDEMILLAVLKK